MAMNTLRYLQRSALSLFAIYHFILSCESRTIGRTSEHLQFEVSTPTSDLSLIMESTAPTQLITSTNYDSTGKQESEIHRVSSKDIITTYIHGDDIQYITRSGRKVVPCRINDFKADELDQYTVTWERKPRNRTLRERDHPLISGWSQGKEGYVHTVTTEGIPFSYLVITNFNSQLEGMYTCKLYRYDEVGSSLVGSSSINIKLNYHFNYLAALLTVFNL